MNSYWVDVLLLTAAQDGAAVDDGEDGGEHAAHDYGRENITIDKLSWHNCPGCKRSVQLGEVQKQPQENLK